MSNLNYPGGHLLPGNMTETSEHLGLESELSNGQWTIIMAISKRKNALCYTQLDNEMLKFQSEGLLLEASLLMLPRNNFPINYAVGKEKSM